MRIVFSAVLLLVGLCGMPAEAEVQGADVIAAGIYTLGKTTEVKDRSISTGRHTQAKTKLVKRTTSIPATKDTVFGIDIRFNGKPRGQVLPLRIVWRYPDPGLRNPDTGTTKMTDEYEETRKLGETTTYYWSLGPDWTLVPGEWTVEVWTGDRMLGKQAFQLQR